MLIRVDEIKDKGLVLEVEEGPGDFPDLERLVAEGVLDLAAPVKTYLRAMFVSGMIEVEGQVETSVRLSCGRCLKPLELPVASEFSLTFTRHLPDVEGEDEDDFELSAEDMGLILFEGDEIDLREAVQEQIVMALPLRALCRDECKGLCPKCGADLNEADCGCQRENFNLKFAALKDFKVEKKK